MKKLNNLNKFIVLQDNARPYSAVKTTDFLQYENIKITSHPSYSLDCSTNEKKFERMQRRRTNVPIAGDNFSSSGIFSKDL